MNSLLNNLITKRILIHTKRWKKFRRPDTPLPDESLVFKGLPQGKREWESEYFPGEYGLEPPKGRIYDTKSFPMPLVAHKEYKWCTCGVSKSQPMCDGSHRRLDGDEMIKSRPIFRPLSFTVNESKVYFLCNCKQSNNRPFCDGSHRDVSVQTSMKN